MLSGQGKSFVELIMKKSTSWCKDFLRQNYYKTGSKVSQKWLYFYTCSTIKNFGDV